MKAVTLITLFCTSALLYSATKETPGVQSPSMLLSRKATVVLPAGYSQDKGHYPVIYLLHGYGGDYNTWARLSPLESYADRYRIILVCPDAGPDSWYLDSQVKKNSLYQRYIALEVVDYIDAHYRTWALKQGRAIIGCSMGGHGALTILTRYPERFCGAGSISGIMELSDFSNQWNIARILGRLPGNEHAWYNASFLSMLDKLRQSRPAIILDCGTNDFAIDGNRKVHAGLLDMGVDHDYFERPGTHNPDYPRKALESHILYFSRILKTAEKPVALSKKN